MQQNASNYSPIVGYLIFSQIFAMTKSVAINIVDNLLQSICQIFSECKVSKKWN